MAVRALGPGKWVIDVYPAGGKGQRLRQTFSGSYEEAIRYEQDLLLGHEGGPCPSHSPTIAQLIPDYFAWATLHLAAATVADLTRSFRVLKPHFGPRYFLKLTTTDVERYKQLRTESGARRIFRSVNKELAYLQSLIKWAVTVKGLPRPRALFSPLPYTRPLPQLPRPGAVERLLAAITPRSRHVERKRAAVLLMWECGLRWNETRVCDRYARGGRRPSNRPSHPGARRYPADAVVYPDFAPDHGRDHRSDHRLPRQPVTNQSQRAKNQRSDTS